MEYWERLNTKNPWPEFSKRSSFRYPNAGVEYKDFQGKQTHRNWFLTLTLCLDIECIMDKPKDLSTFRTNVQVRFCTGHWLPNIHVHLQSQRILSIICWLNEFVSWWWVEFWHIPSFANMEAHKASTEPRVETGCCLGTAFSWQTSHPFPMLVRCLHGQALDSS